MSSKIKGAKEQSWEAPNVISLLPQDIMYEILVRLPRCDYPTLSLVCKHFRSLVASPEIYARRSLLGFTEHCLYVVLYNKRTKARRWYILRRKPNGKRRLVLISSLPAMHLNGSFVAVDSRIYVFGSFTTAKFLKISSSAISIDCRSHTVQTLPSMPIPMANTIANIIGSKIYVMGTCDCHDGKKKKMMVVFNIETQTWEPEMTTLEVFGNWKFGVSVAMADKMYAMNSSDSFAYEPKEHKWETDTMLSVKKWWDACVVDDILYYYDSYNSCLETYDPKQRCWGVVKGVEELSAETKYYGWPNIVTVSYSGKMALFFPKGEARTERKEEIWCAEISLERRQGGEILSKVEWCDQVMVVDEKLYIMKSLAVVVIIYQPSHSLDKLTYLLNKSYSFIVI